MNMKTHKRIAAIQMNSTDSVSENLKTVEKLVRRASQNKAELIVLPENVAFIGKNEKDKLLIAEEPGSGLIQDFFAKLALELKLWLVSGTIPLKAQEEQVFASSIVWNSSGQQVARYDKIHLFDVTVRSQDTENAENISYKTNSSNHSSNKPQGLEYFESKTIASGQDIVTVKSPMGKLGLSVCYDLRFPELYRKLVYDGAEILLVPSAFTAITGEAHWEPLLRARAIENFSYVIAPNQVGIHANGRASYGHSMIIDPWGQILDMISEGEGVIYADIDLAYLTDIRSSFPSLKHRKLFF
jgi:predicted amidohydrolase